MDFVPCLSNEFEKYENRTFREFVLFQESQLLPRYLIWIKKKEK